MQSFESDLSIYVFICNECFNQIITQSGGRGRVRFPEKVVTDVPAHVLSFLGVNFCLGIRLLEVTFVRHKIFGDFFS